jgi:hypothetical protein
MLTTHLHLAPWLTVSGALILLSLSYSYAFMAWKGTNLLFKFWPVEREKFAFQILARGKGQICFSNFGPWKGTNLLFKFWLVERDKFAFQILARRKGQICFSNFGPFVISSFYFTVVRTVRISCSWPQKINQMRNTGIETRTVSTGSHCFLHDRLYIFH